MAEHPGRLPLLSPDELQADQRALYESIAGGPRATGPFALVDDEGRLMGPFNALLHAPGIGAAVERLGVALRFEGTLDARTRELVICAVAAHWASDYEWRAHSRVARSVGVAPAELTALQERRVPDGLSAAEASALRLAGALLGDRAVGADVYDEVVAHHGHEGVVELGILVGYYQLLAGVLAAADVPAPADDEDAGW
ncbi:MAG: carboxymuconolactone decarboxylase family protein [Propionibacteriales bacterium]|nr:carboxymuconolactone decarboxylase family protein [Propionibacteriales bacterium]